MWVDVGVGVTNWGRGRGRREGEREGFGGFSEREREREGLAAEEMVRVPNFCLLYWRSWATILQKSSPCFLKIVGQDNRDVNDNCKILGFTV